MQTEPLEERPEGRTAVPAPAQPFRQATVVLAFLVALVVVSRATSLVPHAAALQTWTAVFVAIVIQSLPFLMMGVLLASAISTLVSERVIERIMPKRAAYAVPVATVAGIGLIGCECASVPIANSVMKKGVGAPAAMSFLLAAPAVNPVVIVSTLVAFPNLPEMALARFVASFCVSLLVGWIWVRLGRDVPLRGSADDHHHGHGLAGFLSAVHHDLISTVGYLVLGAMLAASVNTFVPKPLLNTIGSHAVLGVVVLAGFAFIVALCSQTDAFVAASLTAFSPTAHLAFLVVGPAMDVKLATLETGVFGRRFSMRFVPLVLVVAVATACVVGWVLL